MVVAPGQRGPTSRPRSSVAGVTVSTSAVTQTSASVGDSRRSDTLVFRMRLLMSLDQHRVPVAVKSILPLNGCLIRLPGQINSGKGAHQQQQAGPRQVEVRHQGIDGYELVRRGDVRNIAPRPPPPPSLAAAPSP